LVTFKWHLTIRAAELFGKIIRECLSDVFAVHSTLLFISAVFTVNVHVLPVYFCLMFL